MIVPSSEREATLSGERALVIAVLKQALVDARSTNPATRHDAQEFFAHPERVVFWATLAGVDGDVFYEQIQRAFAPGQPG